MATPEPINGLVGTRAAAEWLDIPFTTLRDMVTARRVPFTKVGKHVRFGQHHLDAIVAAGEESVAKSPARTGVRSIRQGRAA